MKKTDANKKLFLEQLKKTPIIQIVCEKTNIARSSFYRWKNEDPRFANEADAAIEEGILLVNDLAESQLISTIKDKNLGGIMFWLKHRHNAYANKLEVTGKINQVSNEELTPEERAILKQAFRLAAPKARDHVKQNNNNQRTPGSDGTEQALAPADYETNA